MRWFFLIAFILSSTLHLIGSYRRDDKLRNWTKGFIVVALLGFYCFSAEKILLLAVLALVFSWIGDVLLIPKGTKWFIIGGISFIFAHLCFALVYYPHIDFAKIPVWVLIVAAAGYILLTSINFIILKKHLKTALFIPMYFYLLCNSAMNCFALFQLISNPCRITWFVYIGALLFYASDSLLFHARFNKDTTKLSHFPVMFTYIAAEFMIVEGILLYSM